MYHFLRRALFFFLAFVSITSRAGIENLHGTYAILPEEWRHLSLAHGAILVETHWIENFYDYYAAAPAGENTALGKLVKILFYRIPDIGFFSPTKNVKNPKNPITFGQQMAELIFAVATGQKPPITKFRISDGIGLDLKPNIIQNAVDEIKKSSASTPETVSSTMPLVTTIADISGLPAAATSTLQLQLAECAFPEGTVLNILLAIVWSVGNDNRDILNSYYQRIHELIAQFSATKTPTSKKQKLAVVAAIKNTKKEKSALLTASIEPEKTKQTPRKTATQVTAIKHAKTKKGSSLGSASESDKTTISSSSSLITAAAERIITLPEPFSSLPEDIERYKALVSSYNREENILIQWQKTPELFEQFLYLLFLPGKYLTPAPYITVNFTGTDGKPRSFSDCMDTACRNFMNVLWHNHEKNIFTIEEFKKHAPTANPTKELVSFYTNHPNPSLAGSPEVHNDWAQLIGNVPGVQYDKDGYEISSGLRNFIILMNHMLGLNLFPDAVKAAEMPIFVGHYFPLLCEKLGTEFFWDENGQDVLAEKIDAIDNDENREIFTYFIFDQNEKEYTHLLRTMHHTHGIFEYLEAGNLDENVAMILLNKQLDVHPLLHGLSISFLYADNDYAITKSIFVEQKAPIFLFYLPLSNPDLITYVVTDDAWSAIPVLEPCIAHIILGAINGIPDLAIRTSVLLKFKEIALSDSPLNNSFDQAYHEFLSLIKEPKNDEACLHCILVAMGDLAKKGLLEDSVAIHAMQENIHNEDLHFRSGALELLAMLFEKGVIDNAQAIEAAQENMGIDDQDIIESLLILLTALVKKQLAYMQAIATSKEYIGDEDIYISKQAFKLFSLLTEKGLAFKEVLATIKEYANDKPDLSEKLKAQLKTHPEVIKKYLEENPSDKSTLQELNII